MHKEKSKNKNKCPSLDVKLDGLWEGFDVDVVSEITDRDQRYFGPYGKTRYNDYFPFGDSQQRYGLVQNDRGLLGVHLETHAVGKVLKKGDMELIECEYLQIGDMVPIEGEYHVSVAVTGHNPTDVLKAQNNAWVQLIKNNPDFDFEQVKYCREYQEEVLINAESVEKETSMLNAVYLAHMAGLADYAVQLAGLKQSDHPKNEIDENELEAFLEYFAEQRAEIREPIHLSFP